ncbi:hypothetical protein [Paenibacillus sp. L3-i20]|nr:hypothetical protein [Paenibacillus sp. L3-i20]GKU80049.1 hypothetical protein L3i20_v244460 [Paenibacillus sp. L3-i20]
MVTYIVIGLIVFIVVIKAIQYRSLRKRAPSEEQISKLVLSILKRGQSDL